MCTAITFKSADHYFGRNLDLERSYGEYVTVTSRNYPFDFRFVETLSHHYAMIGMATVVDGYPLYYEATNEKGLSIAGLNFPGNADYKPYTEGRDNIAPFEFIPWILGKCSCIEEAREALYGINIINESFSPDLPASPLHWIISDRNASVTVESVGDGLKIYENPLGVMTNNPTFDFHMTNINQYMALHSGAPENRLGAEGLKPFSLGLGAIGLPGDFSSASRFVRAAFVKLNSVCGEGERESVNHFFHILSSVAMPKGCVLVGDGEYEYTRYSCCCNTDKGIYYYNTYENSEIISVDMFASDLDGDGIVSYDLIEK